MGTPEAAAVSLKRLLDDGHQVVGVYTQPDRPSGRGNRISFSPVKDLALMHRLPLFQPVKIRTPEAVAEFNALNADVAVVVAYGRILPEEFLHAFMKGAVNLHFSLLPKYRGAAPVNWAIVNGEVKSGVTTLKMDAGLDTGDILLAKEIEIGPYETASQLMVRLAEIGADTLSKTLSALDEIEPVPQDESAASFAPILKRSDGLVDWTKTAPEIACRIRGFQPFPGTFTYFREKRLTIWLGRSGPTQEAASRPPGTIVSIDDGRLCVSAGSGTSLLIDEIQFEGKRRVTVREVLNSGAFVVGEGFSDLPGVLPNN